LLPRPPRTDDVATPSVGRPRRLVVVVGTGTNIGKTWVSARLLAHLRQGGVTVAARKPAQSFDPSDDPATLDASVLGRASAESPEAVCPPHRWYELAIAPPMAAEALGRPPFSVADLLEELRWPDDGVDVGLVETAGGVRSPLAADGDCLDLCAVVSPDAAVLVADAGLGTINAVRLSAAALGRAVPNGPLIVVLNRFDPSVPLHARNVEWLAERDKYRVVVTPGDEERLVEYVRG